MAKKRTAAELRAEIQRMQDAARELERLEKLEAKKAEEKLCLKLGRIVLDFQKAGFTGFNKTDFIKQVGELVTGAGLTKDEAPATAADDAEGSEDVQGSGTAEPAGEAADAEAIADGSGSGNVENADAAENTTPVETSEKRRTWGN